MENFYKLSVGDNLLSNTDSDHSNIDDAASGDVDSNKDKDVRVCRNYSPTGENTSENIKLANFINQEGLYQQVLSDDIDSFTKQNGDTKQINEANASISIASNINVEDENVAVNSTVFISDHTIALSSPESKRKENELLVCDAILNPLMLEDTANAPGSSSNDDEMIPERFAFSSSCHKMLDTETPCMLCDHVESNMDSLSHFNEYLCHLLVEHKLVIADVKLIADLQSYAIYWKKRFEEESIETFCSKIRTNMGAKDVANSEDYFLLCDALPEDKNIREQLQFDKLKKLLLRQEFERKDGSFSRSCPFCNKLFQGNRLVLFDHMNADHSFNIGHPDNIVNVRELLDDIESKLSHLQCLFCENTFRDRVALREHMRKKGHRRLNPVNKEYDKYYMINYLELGKNWQVMHGESERLDATSDDWSGWCEEVPKSYCFFCTESFDECNKVYEHMKEKHNFDFVLMRKEMQLSFYQQIKLINYIRRQVHMGKQDGCKDIVSKIKNNLNLTTKWNQPQYYFPTYEDDIILCQLENKEGLLEPEDTFVIGEDGIDCRAIINHSVLTDLVVQGYFDA